MESSKKRESQTDIETKHFKIACLQPSEPVQSSIAMQSLILNYSKWTFLYSQLIGFWPISIIQNGRFKTFNRSRLYNRTTLVSLFFIAMNVSFAMFYRAIKTGDYFAVTAFRTFDIIWVIVWDTIVISCNTTIRIFGFIRLAGLIKLFHDIASLYDLCMLEGIVSQMDILRKLKWINNFAKKWIFFAAILGIIHCSCYIYLYISGWESKGREGLFVAWMNIYMEVMLIVHNSNALFMNYFIFLIIFVFEFVTEKLAFKVSIVIYPMNSNSMVNSSQQVNYFENYAVKSILEIVKTVEEIIEKFNNLFAPALLAEAVLSFCQVIFSAYYMHTDPRMGKNVLWAVTFITPILLYPMSLLSLCYFSSELEKKCQDMVSAFENIPFNMVSLDQERKV